MRRNLTGKLELLIICLLAIVPLFIHLPYRVNIFLSWEGAYRISQGQLPFRDFGTPLGGMYWVIPALFFKIFGTGLFTLIIAQVFINILSGLAFRSILKSLGVDAGVRLAAVLLFCVSYSFFNFWPWYNHSVIVYELVGLAFVLSYMAGGGVTPTAVGDRWRGWWRLAAAALFILFSFLTKQDGGGLAILTALVLLAYHGLQSRRWMPLLFFIASFVALCVIVMLPLSRYGFGYWFNHGQPPHTARVSPFDIVSDFFGASQWIKFYIALIVLLLIFRYRSWRQLAEDRQTVLIVLLTICILGEASVLQVTSYTPPDNNIFFHSFGFVCLLSLLAPLLPVKMGSPRIYITLCCCVLLWWSGVWWKYTQRVAGKFLASKAAASPTGENVINKDTYMINRDTTTEIPTEQWVECGLPAFRKITMPAPTVDGIRRLMEMPLVKGARGGAAAGGHTGDHVDDHAGDHAVGGGLRVLNMSELTPLAQEIPYQLERNQQLPLWFHLGVGMFNRQAEIYETRIRDHYYDLVLFEYVPTLNNFYPFRVRDSLQVHYSKVDSFMAPRRGGETQGVIEVFVKQKE